MYAVLKPQTPFNEIFPDRKVPIKRIKPFIPRDWGNPPCYEVDSNRLSDDQIQRLATMLQQTWDGECNSIEQAIAYIKDPGLPLKCDWFHRISA